MPEVRPDSMTLTQVYVPYQFRIKGASLDEIVAEAKGRAVGFAAGRDFTLHIGAVTVDHEVYGDQQVIRRVYESDVECFVALTPGDKELDVG